MSSPIHCAPTSLDNAPVISDLRGKLEGTEVWLGRSVSDIDHIVIHHTAADRDSSAAELAHLHAAINGWPGIGYHFIVHFAGAIDYVGDLLTIRAHIYGLNARTIGIVLTGDFTVSPPGAVQLASTRYLISELRTQIPDLLFSGHRDLALPGWTTACPGDTWIQWKGAII